MYTHTHIHTCVYLYVYIYIHLYLPDISSDVCYVCVSTFVETWNWSPPSHVINWRVMDCFESKPGGFWIRSAQNSGNRTLYCNYQLKFDRHLIISIQRKSSIYWPWLGQSRPRNIDVHGKGHSTDTAMPGKVGANLVLPGWATEPRTSSHSTFTTKHTFGKSEAALLRVWFNGWPTSRRMRGMNNSCGDASTC